MSGGIAKESVASRFQSNKYQGIATKVGAVIGVLLSVIFILMGVVRLNSSKDAPSEEEKLEFRMTAAAKAEIEERIKEFHNERQDQNARLLEGAQKILKSDFTDDERLQALNNLLRNNSDAIDALKVAGYIDQVLESKQKTQAQGSVSIFAAAEKLEAEGRLWDAVQVLNRIRNRVLPTQELKDKRDNWMTRLEGEIDILFEKDIAEVRRLRAEKDYDAALEIIDKIVSYAYPDKVQDAENYRSELSELNLSKQIAEKKKRLEEEKRKYERFIDEVKGLCVSRDFKACISRAFELKGEISEEDLQAKIDGDVEAFTVMDQFMKEALRIIEAKIAKNEPLTIERKNGEKRTAPVARVDKDAIVLRLGGGGGSAELSFDLEQIADVTFFKVVEKEHGGKDERYLIPLGLIFTYRGVLDIAAQHFELATQAGHEVNKWLSKLEQMRARAN